MRIYPYQYPLILNDTVFVDYGGITGTTTPAMRNAAYIIAEMQTSSYIDTLLLPTVLTGSWTYAPGNQFIQTEYGYVEQFLWLRVLDHTGAELMLFSGTNHNYAAVREDTFGYIYVEHCLQGNALNCPYTFQAAYVAGLPTGVANQPNMLMAMTIAAQITLNELLIVPGNESTGDVGVTEYTSLRYHEKRKMWKNTAFGASPHAAKAAQLIDSTFKKARRSVMFGRR